MSIVRRIAFLLAAVTSLTAYDHSGLADTGPCRSIEYERAAFAFCEVDLHKHTVRLYWNRSDGTPYAYLSALPRSLEGGGRLRCFRQIWVRRAIRRSDACPIAWRDDLGCARK